MATATLKARGLMPTLTVDELKKSVEFYTALGFKVTEEMKENGELRGVTLEAGGVHLGLSQDDFAKGRNRTKGVGMRFYLETDQDVTELARQAKAAGVALDSEPAKMPWGPLGFTVTDYDGFKLTIANPE